MSVRRIQIDIKSVTDNRSKDNWNGEHTYYYEPHPETINKGHFMLLGVENSPYFGGFYFFEHLFPDNYPFSPPVWKFLTNDGRTRFNPNLYQINGNGKVCLSILNTWGESSWSQIQRLSSVVETIRAHLFHDKPLINEPGYSDKDPMNEIYSRMLYYQNLNFNVYSNIVQTPKYAEPFKKIMKENFLKNKDYFKKYIDENKIYHGKTEIIRYDNQSVTYNFDELEKKFSEVVMICES
jgi:ubiquitin-protein ligase